MVEFTIQRTFFMATINISLPDPLYFFVEKRVAEDGYSTIGEYFRELVRADQESQAEKKLESLLLDGLNSGSAKPLTNNDLDEVKKAVRNRIAQ
jgi:antitoxin ParD1/3/4